jgi:hypothetical protein
MPQGWHPGARRRDRCDLDTKYHDDTRSSSLEALAASTPAAATRKEGAGDRRQSPAPSFRSPDTQKDPSILDVLEQNGGSEAGRGFPGDKNEVSRDLTDEADQLPAKLERYEKAKRRTLATAVFLGDNGERKLRDKLEGCGTFLHFRHYYTLFKCRLQEANFCKIHLLCVLCAIRRGARHLRAYHERYLWILENEPPMRLQMVTVTVKNGPDLAERLNHLKKIMSSLRQRKKDSKRGKGNSEWGKVLGAVTNIEVTETGKGYHPHSHSIILSLDGLDKEKLSQEILDISGDSYIIDVRDLNLHGDSAKDFSEVFKYSIAFGDLTHEQLLYAYKIMKGKHLISSQGLFRGIPEPDKLTDDPIKDAPYVDFFYKFYESKGYNLEHYHLKDKNPAKRAERQAETSDAG